VVELMSTGGVGGFWAGEGAFTALLEFTGFGFGVIEAGEGELRV